MPPIRKPVPTLRLSGEPDERPTVEFLVRRTVDVPDDDGRLRSVSLAAVELFQVKLPQELTLGDYEELSRLTTSSRELTELQGQMDESEWVQQVTFVYRCLIKLAFHDPVPQEVIYGLAPARLGQIADFLFSPCPGTRTPTTLTKTQGNAENPSTGIRSSSGSRRSITPRRRWCGATMFHLRPWKPRPIGWKSSQPSRISAGQTS